MMKIIPSHDLDKSVREQTTYEEIGSRLVPMNNQLMELTRQVEMLLERAFGSEPEIAPKVSPSPPTPPGSFHMVRDLLNEAQSNIAHLTETINKLNRIA